MSSRATPAPKTSATPAPAAAQTQQAAPPAITPEKIAMRAYEKWCERGCPHGTDQQDWHDAEQELRAQATPPAKQSQQQGQRR